MSDPPRLRTETGSLEALLLRSSPTLEPPADAEEQLWDRLQVAAAAGAAASAAGAAGLAVSHVGASRLVATTAWVARFKWAAVVAVGLPAVGVAAHYVTAAPSPARLAKVAQPVLRQSEVQIPRTPVLLAAPVVSSPLESAPLKAAITPQRSRVTERSVASELEKESRAISTARAKFASGDARGALDDVVRLDAQFPRGGLIQEREVLAIDCLAALGERDVEVTRAQSFLDTFPDSPYTAHVRRLLAR
jgi:hypothetical protein